MFATEKEVVPGQILESVLALHEAECAKGAFRGEEPAGPALSGELTELPAQAPPVPSTTEKSTGPR
jgi:hypothetical protein